MANEKSINFFPSLLLLAFESFRLMHFEFNSKLMFILENLQNQCDSVNLTQPYKQRQTILEIHIVNRKFIRNVFAHV